MSQDKSQQFLLNGNFEKENDQEEESDDNNEELMEYRYEDDWNYGQEDFCEEMDGQEEGKKNKNPEHFDFKCIGYDEAKIVLENVIQNITNSTQLNHSLAKLLLIQTKWDVNEVLTKYYLCDNLFFESRGIKPPHKTIEDVAELCQTKNSFYIPKQDSFNQSEITCDVCLEVNVKKKFLSLICGHSYCQECWFNHLRVNIENGQSINIRCMRTDCQLILPEDFASHLLETTSLLKQKYDSLLFRVCVDSFNKMKHCVQCSTVIEAQEQPAPKKVQCSKCDSSFCFQCGRDYHAPTDCKTIILWHRKCADDSETAHYIAAHTKLCPKCDACIEKNGGCNHMSCYSCHHEFCWVCLGPWSIHGPQYYRCSKYKENADIKTETDRAHEALKKYLFYYERWDNHMKSLKLEDQNIKRIKKKIEAQLTDNNGTWIDWQYLLRGAEILAKCRYTLQYTYPYAYYMESGPQKELFEYQQAELENAIENLAWKIENARTTDRGDLENQMTIVEKRRTTMLYSFFQY